MDLPSPLQTVQTWPLEQRLELVFQLWDDILDSGWQPEMTDELRAELDRRLKAYESNPQDVRTWEQIQARLERGE